MNRTATIELLLDRACAAIQYRLRTEILGQAIDSAPVQELQRQILQDRRVRQVLGWQQADGYLGLIFHGGLHDPGPQLAQTRGAEGALRFLREMGLRPDHPGLQRACQALLADNWFRDRAGVCWKHYPAVGLQGLDLVRAATLAHAGVTDHEILVQQQYEALRTLLGITGVRSMTQISEPFQRQQVYRPGVAFPETYHLRLLAHTRRWRHGANPMAVAQAVNRLYALSPRPPLKVRHRSRCLGPATILPLDLTQDLARMPAAQWPRWLETTELVARLGIAAAVPPLQRQLQQLESLLDRGSGLFRHPARQRGWGSYGFGALQPHWAGDAQAYDLTFRCLLILHHADQTPSVPGP